jgi:hypothetical protein
MAWGLEARVPFLDKAFLEAAMNIDPKEKMFRKGRSVDVDEDGEPRMEKVGLYEHFPSCRVLCFLSRHPSISSAKRLIALQMARY